MPQHHARSTRREAVKRRNSIGSHKGLIGDSGLVLAARLISILANILIAPLFIQRLGLEQYGIWALATVAINYLTLMDLGMYSAVVRISSDAGAREDRSSIVRVSLYAFTLYSALSITATIILITLMEPLLSLLGIPSALRDAASVLLFLAVLRFAMLHLVSVALGVLVGLGRIRTTAILTGLGNLAYGMSAVLVLLYDPSLLAVGVAALSQAVPPIVASAYLVPRAVVKVPGSARDARTPRELRKELLVFGGWLQVANVANAVNTQTDALILAVLFGPTLTGRYELANRLALPVRLIGQPLLDAAYPRLSNMSHASNEDDEASLKSYSWHLLLLTAGGGTAYIFISAPYLLEAWLGEQIPGSSFMARALVLGIGASMVSGIASTSFRADGRAEIEGKLALATALLNVTLSLILGYAVGWQGVIVASVVAASLHSAMMLAVYGRIYRARPFSHFEGTSFLRLLWVALSAGISISLVSLMPGIVYDPGPILLAASAGVPFLALAIPIARASR